MALDFYDLPIDDELLDGVEAAGYTTCTPIQEAVIPIILDGFDVIACAQTGTGKTAAFLVPLIQRLLEYRVEGDVNSLILVPTRELAVQITQHLEGLLYYTPLSCIAIYGGNNGENFVTEKRALSKGADIVVATPGRFIAHLNMGYAKLSGLQCLVLDEADRMLDMGFVDDIRKIITFLPDNRQTLMFSATMPPKIKQLAEQILHQPKEVNIAISKPPEKIVQKAFGVYEPQKIGLVKSLLAGTSFKSALVFCSSKASCNALNKQLQQAKLKVAAIHSDLQQQEREDVLGQYISGQLSILVATDILSRGIDIDTIDLVINYDVPHDGEDYVHRIGRTARAEADGVAYTLVTPKEQRRFLSIERLLGKEVPKGEVPEALGETPKWEAPRSGGDRPKGKKKFYPKRRPQS